MIYSRVINMRHKEAFRLKRSIKTKTKISKEQEEKRFRKFREQEMHDQVESSGASVTWQSKSIDIRKIKNDPENYLSHP
jgi:hypothetical protein